MAWFDEMRSGAERHEYYDTEGQVLIAKDKCPYVSRVLSYKF